MEFEIVTLYLPLVIQVLSRLPVNRLLDPGRRFYKMISKPSILQATSHALLPSTSVRFLHIASASCSANGNEIAPYPRVYKPGKGASE